MGALPIELADLKSLRALELSGNRLTGEIPANFFAMPTIGQLWLDSNDLSGSISDAILEATLYILNLAGNGCFNATQVVVDRVDELHGSADWNECS